MKKEIIKQRVSAGMATMPYQEAIQKIALFGSCLHGTATAKSDVDLLIEFTPGAPIGFFQLSHILQNLEGSLHTKVDLVTPDALGRYFREEVLAEAETLYEKK
jgi:predicted nucleotidyltransferase